MKRSREWAQRNVGQDIEIGRPKKKPRLESFQDLVALDNMLSVGTGSGLSQFSTVDEQGHEQPPEEWRILSLSPDQGPDCKCAVNFLQFSGMSLVVDCCDDMSHGAWNDIRAMLKGSGAWSHQLLMMCAYNTPYGSAPSPARLDQARLALEWYLRDIDIQQDQLFQHFMPLILQDAGLSSLLHQEGVIDHVKALLLDPQLLKKGDKVSLVRFMRAIYKARAEDVLWNRRALIYTVLCLELGYESSKKRSDMLASVKSRLGSSSSSSKVDVDDQKETMTREQKILAIKGAAENQVHIACMMFSDREQQLTQRCIVHVCDAATQWHSTKPRVALGGQEHPMGVVAA